VGRRRWSALNAPGCAGRTRTAAGCAGLHGSASPGRNPPARWNLDNCGRSGRESTWPGRPRWPSGDRFSAGTRALGCPRWTRPRTALDRITRSPSATDDPYSPPLTSFFPPPIWRSIQIICPSSHPSVQLYFHIQPHSASAPVPLRLHRPRDQSRGRRVRRPQFH